MRKEKIENNYKDSGEEIRRQIWRSVGGGDKAPVPSIVLKETCSQNAHRLGSELWNPANEIQSGEREGKLGLELTLRMGNRTSVCRMPGKCQAQWTYIYLDTFVITLNTWDWFPLTDKIVKTSRVIYLWSLNDWGSGFKIEADSRTFYIATPHSSDVPKSKPCETVCAFLFKPRGTYDWRCVTLSVMNCLNLYMMLQGSREACGLWI